KARRHIFPPRHEMMLVVAMHHGAGEQLLHRSMGIEADSAIGIPLLTVRLDSAQGYPQGDGAALALGDIAPRFPHMRFELILEQGKHRLRQYDQVGCGLVRSGRLCCELQMSEYAPFERCGVEFLRLLDVALY